VGGSATPVAAGARLAAGRGGERRYIVCRNHDEPKKDAADRAAILAALERQRKKGDKALVGNTGYRRFLASTGEDRFAIDYARNSMVSSCCAQTPTLRPASVTALASTRHSCGAW
jgi:hypothetical protein